MEVEPVLAEEVATAPAEEEVDAALPQNNKNPDVKPFVSNEDSYAVPDEIKDKIKQGVIPASMVYSDAESIKTVKEGVRDIASVSLTPKEVSDLRADGLIVESSESLINRLIPSTNGKKSYIVGQDTQTAKDKIKRLKKVLESQKNEVAQKIEIGELLGYQKQDIIDFVERNYNKKGVKKSNEEIGRIAKWEKENKISLGQYLRDVENKKQQPTSPTQTEPVVIEPAGSEVKSEGVVETEKPIVKEKPVAENKPTPPTAKEKLAQAHEKWLSKQNKQGIIFDPKSQAENDIEFLKAILSYIKEEAITTYENFKKALKEFGVYDESKDDDWREVFEGTQPESEEDGPEFKKSRAAKRAVEGGNLQEFDDQMEEIGYLYEVESTKKAGDAVKNLFEEYGPDAIIQGIRDGKIKGAVASRAWVKVVNLLNEQFLNAKTKEEMEAILTKQADLVKEVSLMGTEYGQFNKGFADAYMESDFKFDVASMVNTYKEANAGQISTEMMEQIKTLSQEISDLTKKLAENEEAKAKLEEAAILNAYAESQEREDKRPQGIKDAAKAAANRVRRLKIARPEYINSASPAVIAWDTAVEVVALSLETSGTVAQAIEKGLKSLRESKWYKSVSKDIQDKVEADFAAQNTDKATPEPEYIDGKVKVTRGAIAALVRQGYDTIDKVVDRVHEMLGDPNLSKRKIRDTITRYGKTINPTKDEIQKKVNELTRIGRKISQIEDARNKIRPLRSGLQRDKLVEEERRLQKELNNLLKALPPSEVDLSKAIKTATDAIKTRLQNQIEDLETQIKRKERTPSAQKTPRFSIEELMLKDQRDALQKTLDDLVGKPEISDEQKIQDAIEATEKSLAEYQRRINEMDFSSFGKPKGPESPELKKLREERDALKEQYELLKKGPPKSEEQKKLERLQKELDELQKNGLKDPKGKPIDSPAAKALKTQIEAIKKTLGKDKSYETALKIAQKKLQDLEDKITNKKLEIAKKVQKEQKGPELDAVRTQIENTEKTLKQLREDAGIIAKAKLDAWKKVTREAAEKYESKLKKGEYPTAKTDEAIKLSDLDQEGKDLLSRKIRAKEKYVKAVNEAKRNQEKVTFGFIVNTLAGALRLVLATGEWSFIMIQNKMLASGLLFRNPKALLDAFKTTFKAMASHGFSEKLVEDVKAQDFYPEMKASGLTIIDDFTAESMKDETTHFTTAQILWKILEAPVRLVAFGDNPLTIKKDKNDIAHEIYKDANPFEDFERAANAFGNAMRVIEFLRGREMLIKKGITFEDNPKAYKQLGAGINTMTNRTSLGKYLEPGTPVWNLFFFSARNWASVLKNLPPISFFYYGSKIEGADMKSITTPERTFKIKGKEITIPSKTFSVPTSASPIQKMYIQNFMSFVGLAMGTVGSFALYQALATMGDDDEEKEKYDGPKVEFDLRSSGALKVQFGNQYLDVFGGYQQQVVLFTRIITDILIDQGYVLDGSYKSMTKGNISRLGESMYVPTKGDLMLNMVRNKLSPAAALGWDYSFSVLDTEEGTRELNGREIDLKENFDANLKPMYWQAVKETAEEQPLLTATFLDGLGFIGASINTLKDQPKTTAQKARAKYNPNEEAEKKAKEHFRAAIETGNMEVAKEHIQKLMDAQETKTEKYQAVKKVVRSITSEKELTDKIGIEEKYLDEFFQVLENQNPEAKGRKAIKIKRMQDIAADPASVKYFKDKLDAEYSAAKKVLDLANGMKVRSAVTNNVIEFQKPVWMKKYERIILGDGKDFKPTEKPFSGTEIEIKGTIR